MTEAVKHAARVAVKALRRPPPTTRERELRSILPQLGVDYRRSVPLRRAEVVSEQLCDDTIRYLAPSLEKHRGCVILDLHPGACMWTQKLHDFLQPRRHILVESDPALVKKFVLPLCSRDQTKYRHSSLELPYHKFGENLSRILQDPDLMPPDALARRDATTDPASFNPDLLVVGNLARHFIRSKTPNARFMVLGRAFRYACAATNHLMANALTRRLIHAHGNVRCLFWMSTEQAKYMIPPASTYRTAFNTFTHFAGRVTAVVSGQESENLAQEHPTNVTLDRLDAVRGDAAVTRMCARAAAVLPPWRQPVLATADHRDGGRRAHKPLFGDLCSTIDALEAYVKKWHARFEEMTPILLRGRRGPIMQDFALELYRTVEFPQAATITLYGRQSSMLKSTTPLCRFAVLVDLGLRIVKAEASLLAIESQQHGNEDGRLAALRERVFELRKPINDYLGSINPSQSGEVAAMTQDIIAVETEQRWSGRSDSLAPIPAYRDEFVPDAAMSLVDLDPCGRDLTVEGLADRDETVIIANILLKTFFLSPRDTVKVALNRTAHGAADWIIPRVPLLRDALRGGRLDPENMEVRDLSEDMFADICTAFVEWPFRPATMELELADFGIETPSMS